VPAVMVVLVVAVIVVAAGVLVGMARGLVGVWSVVGVGVLDAAVAVAFASHRLIGRRGVGGHGRQATPGGLGRDLKPRLHA
jgi:hypothetical protein